MLVGVVGKPSVGKSTFFKAATLAEVEIANYPFTTVKPNSGVGYVRVDDPATKFGKVSNPRNGYVLNGQRFVPVQMIDVAGLVPGAHTGLGMGNAFLDDLRQADVLIHVIDVSGSVNEKGESVPTLSYDPAKDVTFLEEELDMWYLGILKKGWEKFARSIQQEKGEVHKALGKQLSGLGANEDVVKNVLKTCGLGEDPTKWGEEDLLALSRALRLHTKPMIIACNKIDVEGAAANFDRLVASFPDHTFIACSAESELALRQAAKHSLIEYVPGYDTFSFVDEGKLNSAQKNALDFISTNMLEKFHNTGVQQVLNEAVFSTLNYIAVYPGGVTKLEDKDGNVIPDCFLIPGGSTALQFAYKLHTDFGKNFIRAIDVKTKRTVGKEHVLADGDIVEIVSGK